MWREEPADTLAASSGIREEPRKLKREYCTYKMNRAVTEFLWGGLILIGQSCLYCKIRSKLCGRKEMLKQIKYFLAVAECNSFTEAAERCFISQSAISQQISALEENLGVQLIKREKRKFSLTAAHRISGRI